MPLPWLEPDEIGFPPTTAALDEPNGLLAVGDAPATPLRAFAAPDADLRWSPSPHAPWSPARAGGPTWAAAVSVLGCVC